MIISLCIIAATAATLHGAGTTTIATAADAAAALRPIAGDFAFALFAIGIIGTGLLAVPVLASRSDVMGKFRARGAQGWLGWGAVLLMALSAAGMFLL